MNHRSKHPLTVTAAIGFHLLISAAGAQAHDPGLSESSVRFETGELVVQAEFAWRDLRHLIPLDSDGDGEFDEAEYMTFRNVLADVGGMLYSVRASDDELELTSTGVSWGGPAHGDINFEIRYALPKSATLAAIDFEFLVAEDLPVGHRHHVQARGGNGTEPVNQLLHQANSIVSVPVKAPLVAAMSASESPHTLDSPDDTSIAIRKSASATIPTAVIAGICGLLALFLVLWRALPASRAS